MTNKRTKIQKPAGLTNGWGVFNVFFFKNSILSDFVKFLSAFAKAVSVFYTTFAPEINRVLLVYALPVLFFTRSWRILSHAQGMENNENNNHSEQESSSHSQHRHEAAKDYTKELIEEILSSNSKDN